MESESGSNDNIGESTTATEFQVVQLVESFQNVEGVAIASPTNHICTNSSSNIILGTIPKGKYYKQTYRPAWEQMPDFKGWLRGVENEPTRAYCTYCHKTLHAHRLSLLKHTCTIRHQKAAQYYSSQKNKLKSLKKSESATMVHGSKSDASAEIYTTENEDVDELNVEFPESVDVEGTEIDFDDDDDDEDEEDSETHDIQKDGKMNNFLKPAVSTEVTDLSKGRPITGLQVSLYKLVDGRWTYINEGVTGSTGKVTDFLARSDFTLGRYKLHYDVDRYFEARKQNTMYPFIEIVFDCHLYTDSHHIPLLLSPFGYTTYKGS
ncbi:unnamed protein product [Phaedon cochleariae]|uniref:hydroxyisourate hydrolase n=1 Tax=Phaedon cochleariae TaxID=80249 RepID=A0A9P0DIT4_PHACE|nr:unnamed protein product [Phaedon cochleariae]